MALIRISDRLNMTDMCPRPTDAAEALSKLILCLVFGDFNAKVGLDVKTFRGAIIDFDHFLVTARFRAVELQRQKVVRVPANKEEIVS